MSGPDEHCELCDLPLSTCVHGMPKPAAQPASTQSTSTRRASTQAGSTRSTSAGSASARKRAVPKKAGASTSVRTTQKPRRWTPPAEFVPHVVAVLEEAGGSLPTDDALERIEERVGDRFRSGDHERTPQGELRWRTAARKARQELVAAGRISADVPGIWQLTD